MKIFYLAFFCLALNSVVQAQEQLLGKWLTQDKDAVVEIYNKNDRFYGKIISLMPSTLTDGSPILDQFNPDKSLQSRSVKGIDIIVDFKWDSKKQELFGGKVYDPNNGKYYKGKLWIEDGDLKMRGYVAFLFRTETWTKTQ